MMMERPAPAPAAAAAGSNNSRPPAGQIALSYTTTGSHLSPAGPAAAHMRVEGRKATRDHDRHQLLLAKLIIHLPALACMHAGDGRVHELAHPTQPTYYLHCIALYYL